VYFGGVEGKVTSNRSANGGREDPAARGIVLTVFTAWAKTRSIHQFLQSSHRRQSIPIESAIAEGPGPDGKLEGRWRTRQTPLKKATKL